MPDPINNPVATIGTTLPVPPVPHSVRRSYERVDYSKVKFMAYGVDEPSSFDPGDKGGVFYVSKTLADALGDSPVGYAKPSFVSTNAWQTYRDSASCFVVPAISSIMPKLMVPSYYQVDNGVITTSGNYKAKTPDSSAYDLFNWTLNSINGNSVSASQAGTFVAPGGGQAAQYIASRAKYDSYSQNDISLTLNAPANPPEGSSSDWSGDLVGGGSFCLALGVTPNRTVLSKSSASSTADNGNNPWAMKFVFGNVTMILQDGGALKVTVLGGDPQGNVGTVNLASGQSKEGPPQQSAMQKVPFIITVIPVWNGIVVMNGVQDSANVSATTATYIPLFKAASWAVEPYSVGFDTTNPDEVKVGVGSGSTSVKVDFGTQIDVNAENCAFELAYIPCYHSRQGNFDEFRLMNKPVGGITYTYNEYPIWTDNGTSYALAPVAPRKMTDTGTPGPSGLEDLTYWKTTWGLETSAHMRSAAQLMGSILMVQEESDESIRNGNGAFDLTWTGGSPADPTPATSWTKYITSLNVTVGLDGSSGSITVDKYGIAGQDAIAVQSIGGITIDMTGGYGTQEGRIFAGLALGMSDKRDSNGAEWTIPLIGLEKKFEDMALINVPFVDGEYFVDAASFLAGYAGVVSDFTYDEDATTDQLSSSADVNVARFDWKSGTPVRSAFDDICNDLARTFVVRDGKIFFYKLNPATGFPIDESTNDWSVDYPSVKVQSYDITPDFDNLRNQIVGMSMQSMPQGQNTNQEFPQYPRIVTVANVTVPDIPWMRAMVESYPGFMSVEKLNDIATNRSIQCKNYELFGSVSIPGDARIKPYDFWGEYIISSVSHSVDFNSKTWTTSLELAKAGI